MEMYLNKFDERVASETSFGKLSLDFLLTVAFWSFDNDHP